jgi:hypothetical protein
MASTINNVYRDTSSYQDLPAESILILEVDLGTKHRTHDSNSILPCGADGSHRTPCMQRPRSHSATQLLRSILSPDPCLTIESTLSSSHPHQRVVDLTEQPHGQPRAQSPARAGPFAVSSKVTQVSTYLLISRSGLHVSQSLYLPPGLNTCTFLPSFTQPSMSKKCYILICVTCQGCMIAIERRRLTKREGENVLISLECSR